MIQLPPPTSGIAQTIQLSIAPVFLLSAVGVYLGVLTNRLSRIIDRTRALEVSPGVEEDARLERLQLDRRRRLILQAINMCTYSAVLIAGVIATLFLGAFVELDLSGAVGWAFVAAMVALVFGLLNFLREVQLALRWVRRGGPLG